jgi:two-component system chemotaxis response regulator CheY
MKERHCAHKDLPVLIIDDMRSARAILGDMLKDLGFKKTIEARDGAEALAKLKQNEVQLILCDFLMDGMNGVDFLKELKKSYLDKSPPVIFVSSLGDVASVETAMELGATDYLVKPVSFGKFRRKVENSLGMRPATGESSQSEESDSYEVPSSPHQRAAR